MGGLGRLAVAALLASVLLAGLLLPYAVGVGLASNTVTDAIATTPVTDMDEPLPQRTTITDAQNNTIAVLFSLRRRLAQSDATPRII